jgi:hypothetical protein
MARVSDDPIRSAASGSWRHAPQEIAHHDGAGATGAGRAQELLRDRTGTSATAAPLSSAPYTRGGWLASRGHSIDSFRGAL